MVRPLVHSFVIAAVLSSLVDAGPCRPSSSSAAVILTTTESSVATGSAATQTKQSTSTEEPSGASTETSLTASEQSITTDSALSTIITTTTSESYSSTDSTIDITTTTECPVPEPPVYDDPFTATHTEEPLQTTTEVAVDLVPRGRARRDARNLLVRAAATSSEAVEEDVATTTEDPIVATETTASTNSEETTATTEDATTTTQDVTTTTEDATATTETAATTTSEAASGCVNNLQKPSPEGSVCGKKGYVSSNSADWRYLGQGPSSSLLDCYTSCMQQSNCVTFYYEKDMQCTLWRGTITELSTDETSFTSYETS